MASRVYNIIGQNQTVLGATTLIGLRPGTTCALEILRMWASQNGNATSAQTRISWGMQAAVLATVVAATPTKTQPGADPASQIVGGTALAAGTCGINASAEGAGVKSPIGEEIFNNLNGWLWQPTPNDTIIIGPGLASSFYTFFTAAPGILTGWSFGITFKEIG